MKTIVLISILLSELMLNVLTSSSSFYCNMNCVDTTDSWECNNACNNGNISCRMNCTYTMMNMSNDTNDIVNCSVTCNTTQSSVSIISSSPSSCINVSPLTTYTSNTTSLASTNSVQLHYFVTAPAVYLWPVLVLIIIICCLLNICACIYLYHIKRARAHTLQHSGILIYNANYILDCSHRFKTCSCSKAAQC